MSEQGAGFADGVTAGTLLRQAREAAGLHVETLAATLKVPVRKLEALEQDRYEELPDAVFTRALASTVCRTLKVDPQPVLERLPHTAQPDLVRNYAGMNTPFRAPSDGPKPGWIHQVSRPVVIIVLALLLAVVVVVFLPVAQRDDAAPAPVGQSTSEPVMPPGSPGVTSAPAEPIPGDTPGSSSTTTAPLGQRAAGAAAPGALPLVAAPSLQAAAAKPLAAASASAGAPAASASAANVNGIVVFRTRGNSWVQVTDAKGTTVFRRLMEAGETAGASGPLPLTVTIGSAQQTEVQVRGKPFNLGPVSRDNVARFEVK